MIKVKLFAAAAQLAGRREVEGPWEGLSAAQLLAALQEAHPALQRLGTSVMLAVNQEFAAPDQIIAAGDEVAVIPPVSGGAGPDAAAAGDRFEITTAPLSADAVAAKVIDPYKGAVLTFVGTVREFTHGRQTVHLEYEAYPAMAVHQMRLIAQEIEQRWPGAATAMAHRTGKLEIGEASVVIAVATPHRADAFAACRHAIERLKQVVPIWKKEVWQDGECWVGAQDGPPPAP